jgi:hypothetical protein
MVIFASNELNVQIPKIAMNATSWTDNKIDSLVSSFKTCTIPRSEWTHQAHLIVALWHLTHYSQQDATNTLRHAIQQYNQAIGIKSTKNSGYHETITLFWVRMIRHYLAVEGKNRSIADLANGLIQNYGNPRLTLEYYSSSLLMSQEARQTWVEPDLKPLEPLLKR